MIKKMTYNNCLLLPIPTSCIIRTPQLNVLDFKQSWNGWPFGKFLESVQMSTKHAMMSCAI